QPFSAELARSPDGGTWIPLVEVDVPVRGMDTGNHTRDGKMREMFQSDRYPVIHGTVREIDVDGIRREIGKEGGGKAFFDLTLGIRDVERTVHAAVTNFREEGSRVGFDVEFPISLADFGLEAPSFLGIFRVRDKVTVTGNVRLEVSSKL
ncbi:MAG: YceI family protein, partial [Thermodesulfobacteriota bacterium]|nr:YceI family protein [Thermodesulfobacteriota bacterium]